MTTPTIPWIPIYGDLPTHRKCVELEALTGVDRIWTHVLELWLWCSRNRPDGGIGDLTPLILARVASVPKLRAAAFHEGLRKVGFLDADGRLHAWDDYGGAYLKKRAADRSRLKRWRDRKETRPESAGEARPNGVSKPGRSASRGEGERKEKREGPPSPPVVGSEKPTDPAPRAVTELELGPHHKARGDGFQNWKPEGARHGG